MTYVNPTLMEMVMHHNMLDIEREIEKRRVGGELVHAPFRIRKDFANFRRRVSGRSACESEQA